MEKKVFEKEKMTRFARSKGSKVELVSKELNHLTAILHVYARSLIFMKQKKKEILSFFKKKMEILLHF